MTPLELEQAELNRKNRAATVAASLSLTPLTPMVSLPESTGGMQLLAALNSPGVTTRLRDAIEIAYQDFHAAVLVLLQDEIDTLDAELLAL